MRADDQATWRYVTDDGEDIGENLALQILRVLLGWRINGRLAIGCGLPAKRLNLPSFLLAAQQCRELVNRSAGGLEPRYRGAGVVSEGDDPRSVLDALCAACNGRLRDTAGRLSLVIMHDDLALAAADEGLDADDVVGGFTWNPDPAMDQVPNVVRGRYTDPSPNSLYQQLPYPDVSVPNNTGIERPMSLDLSFVESPSQAQRVAKQVLQRRQHERTFQAPFDIRAWRYPVGAVLPFTFPPLGFVRQLFRVSSQEVGTDGSCDMTLTMEDHAIYAWDRDDRAPVKAAAAVTYDPARGALVQAIEEAGARGARRIATSLIDGQFASSASSLTLPAQTDVVLDDGTVAPPLPAATVSDLEAATTYIVTWSRSGSAYSADPAPAATRYQDADRIIVRQITTSLEDGTYPPEPTPGGGDGGPGWGGGYQPGKQIP